jgi:hypothetical protein
VKSFCKTIKKVENKNVSASEVAEELDLLVDTISRRKHENFQTTQITTLISKLENEGLITESEYLQSLNLFYDTFIEYLEKWACPFETLHPFKWVQLKTPPHRIWRSVVKTHFQEVSCTDLYNLLQQNTNLLNRHSVLRQIPAWCSRVGERQRERECVRA